MSVPNHSPGTLASAGAGRPCGHVDSLGKRLYRHDDLGHDNPHGVPANLLVDVHREPPVAAANGLDVAQTRNECIGHTQNLRQLVHTDDLRSRPRADRPSIHHPLKYASGSRNSNREVLGDGFQFLNGVA